MRTAKCVDGPVKRGLYKSNFRIFFLFIEQQPETVSPEDTPTTPALLNVSFRRLCCHICSVVIG